MQGPIDRAHRHGSFLLKIFLGEEDFFLHGLNLNCCVFVCLSVERRVY
ncbi:MAG: hypothetical protein ACJA0W_003570 [Candidatus Azotimanducaceae bacterium]|jgi:hypothetical protein